MTLGSSVILANPEIRLDTGAFVSARQRFLLNAGLSVGQHAGLAGRADGAMVRPNFKRTRLDKNARRIDAMLLEEFGRGDGYSANAGYHLARDLEHIIEEVLTEPFPLPNAFRVFNLDESIPAGAASYTIRRQYEIGEARVWRGPGSEVPRVTLQQREESQPIRHLVSGYGWDLFEMLADRFANKNRQADLLRVCRDVLMQLANRIWWQGSEADGLFGIFNYPYLPKKVIPEGFSQATVAANPDDTLAAMHSLANFPQEVSKGEYVPDTICLTNHVQNVLSQVRFASGSDVTILEHFMKTTPHIKRVEVCWELEDAGGSGVDGILVCRTDQRGIRPVMSEGVTQLPVQEKGLESSVINYMSIGGVRINDPLCNVLGFADTAL